MPVLQVQSYVQGRWISPGPDAQAVLDAVTGEPVAMVGHPGLDMQAVLDHARSVGGPALRALTFHDRARMLKALAGYLQDRKQPLYDLSFTTGATSADHLIDIDGGIGTLFVYASKGRRELPDAQVLTDGPVEQLSRDGSFLGQHIWVPRQGVAVQINAFNFPVWGMLEKLAPAILAGVPVIVKPATASCHVAEACARMIVESGIMPEGAFQVIAGTTGDLLDRLGGQDTVSFTGSAETAFRLKSTTAVAHRAVRFIAEQDSLNAAILGPDADPDSPEFDLFLDEVTREMTVKAGQKCTAIRRILVPLAQIDAVIGGLAERLAAVRIGDPRLPGTQLGPLISCAQRDDVLARAALIATEATRVFGDPDDFHVEGADPAKGAFLPPILYHCTDPDTAQHVHRTEAFGPVATILPYRDTAHAIALANRGQGSLVVSVFSHDACVARQIALGAAAFHGRLYVNNRDTAGAATGHGAPLPHMVHGGPGRAGGAEEQGGIRGVLHYMQRTAVQGSADILTAVTGVWVPGSAAQDAGTHPFRRHFGALQIGETLHTAARKITLEDIEHFARFTGDTFYAHMDDAAAAANPFFPGRVAHGYLLLSFAAGLFVDPDPGPVLANTGLDALRFLKPVQPGDSIAVRLTVKQKTPRSDTYGEVRWHVTLTNQHGERVAEYELLTMNAFGA